MFQEMSRNSFPCFPTAVQNWWVFTRRSICLPAPKTFRKKPLQVKHHVSFANFNGIAFAKLLMKFYTLMDALMKTHQVSSLTLMAWCWAQAN